MKRIIFILAAFTLAGCSSVGQLQNRLVTTLDGSRAFVNSLYGPVGISTELDKADADALKALRTIPAASAAK